VDSVSPVYNEETVGIERVIALDHPEYIAIIILPVRYHDGTQGMAVRFRFTDDERNLVANGGDLLLTEITFGGNKFTPVSLEIVPKDGVC
jgi:hypothetical protein